MKIRPNQLKKQKKTKQKPHKNNTAKPTKTTGSKTMQMLACKTTRWSLYIPRFGHNRFQKLRSYLRKKRVLSKLCLFVMELPPPITFPQLSQISWCLVSFANKYSCSQEILPSKGRTQICVVWTEWWRLTITTKALANLSKTWANLKIGLHHEIPTSVALQSSYLFFLRPRGSDRWPLNGVVRFDLKRTLDGMLGGSFFGSMLTIFVSPPSTPLGPYRVDSKNQPCTSVTWFCFHYTIRFPSWSCIVKFQQAWFCRAAISSFYERRVATGDHFPHSSSPRAWPLQKLFQTFLSSFRRFKLFVKEKERIHLWNRPEQRQDQRQDQRWNFQAQRMHPKRCTILEQSQSRPS